MGTRRFSKRALRGVLCGALLALAVACEPTPQGVPQGAEEAPVGRAGVGGGSAPGEPGSDARAGGTQDGGAERSAMAPRLQFREASGAIPAAARDRACMDAAAVDLDEDGDIDLVLAIEFGPNQVLLNSGAGSFELLTSVPASSRDSEDVLVADFDSDGDLDFVFVSEDDRINELWLNDGALGFEIAPELPVRGVSNGAIAVDLNGDGAVDIVLANNGDNAVAMGGVAGFVDETSARFPAGSAATSQDVEAGDVDGDGDWDLIWANEGQNQLWLNDGEGFFRDATERLLPALDDETREADFADLDGDGDLDLVYGNVQLFQSGADPQNRVLLNDGQGRFEQLEGALPQEALSSFDVDAADLDGDGRLELLAANWRGRGPGPLTVYRAAADPLLGFEAVDVGAASVVEAGLDIEVADFDGDGRPDIYLCSRGGVGGGSPGRADHLLLQD